MPSLPRSTVSRSTLIRLTLAGAAAAAVPAVARPAGTGAGPGPAPGSGQSAGPSRRAVYHFTVPDGWKNDPQRPFHLDGVYHYPYLYNADYEPGGAGGGGTAWRVATTRDQVVFEDQGVAVPKFTQPNGDVWSGSAVVDTEDSAGFGPGAVVALVTQAHAARDGAQAQFLWASTDGGKTFRPQGEEPVLPNPGTEDFRDPKIVRDERDGEDRPWLMLLAEGTRIGFYRSADLRTWAYAGDFAAEGYGVLECPDLFTLTTDDGEAVHVLGTSANGTAAGLPATYAYWTGTFDGRAFHPHHPEPRWLDHGFDWYGAVTYPRHLADGTEDPHTRYALAWMNHWDYPHDTPTATADGFNGTDSLVREVTVARAGEGDGDDGGGPFVLRSAPVRALHRHAEPPERLGTRTVRGHTTLPFRAEAYALETELSWSRGSGPVGLRLRESADGSRHADVGVHDGHVFVNRAATGHPKPPDDAADPKTESRTPLGPEVLRQRRVRLRIYVDRTSVEVFVGDGRHVHSSQIHPEPADQGITLFAEGGRARFADLVLRRFTPPGDG